MQAYYDAQVALSTRFNALAKDLGVQVWQENAKRTEPPAVLYFQPWFIPAGSRALGLGFSAPHCAYGIFQVDVVDIVGSGWLPSRKMADAICTAFHPGLKLPTTASGALRIDKSYSGRSLPIEARLKTPVTVEWWITYTAN